MAPFAFYFGLDFVHPKTRSLFQQFDNTVYDGERLIAGFFFFWGGGGFVVVVFSGE